LTKNMSRTLGVKHYSILSILIACTGRPIIIIQIKN
jgi:hypothetical protein